MQDIILDEKRGKILSVLLNKYIQHGRKLDQYEINNIKDIPCTKVIKQIFGVSTINDIWDEIERKTGTKLINIDDSQEIYTTNEKLIKDSKKIIGLEYVVKLRGFQYPNIANELGIYKQTINSWITERSKIPEKYLSILSKRFNVNEEILQKELSNKDKVFLLRAEIKRLESL